MCLQDIVGARNIGSAKSATKDLNPTKSIVTRGQVEFVLVRCYLMTAHFQGSFCLHWPIAKLFLADNQLKALRHLPGCNTANLTYYMTHVSNIFAVAWDICHAPYPHQNVVPSHCYYYCCYQYATNNFVFPEWLMTTPRCLS